MAAVLAVVFGPIVVEEVSTSGVLRRDERHVTFPAFDCLGGIAFVIPAIRSTAGLALKPSASSR